MYLLLNASSCGHIRMELHTENPKYEIPPQKSCFPISRASVSRLGFLVSSIYLAALTLLWLNDSHAPRFKSSKTINPILNSVFYFLAFLGSTGVEYQELEKGRDWCREEIGGLSRARVNHPIR
jgi:hypothetical protein